MKTVSKKESIVSRFAASWALENAFGRASKGEFEAAIDLVQKTIKKSRDGLLEARLLEGHCHWCLGNTAAMIKSFVRVREMMERSENLSRHDRSYLLRYAMVHFKKHPDISPFRDMEIPDAPALGKVTKRFKTQFPMEGKE